ncbi:MAG: hypothetical protein PHS14_20255, partial [Elusimicrobia bacterium]|nr:hypothetical protein [Elusimicrobiota bacterium]
SRLETFEARHKEELRPLQEAKTKLEGMMADALDEIGVENVKTSHGTVYFTRPENMKVVDKEVFFEWVVAEGAFDVLTSAVSKDAIKERGVIPPGVESVKIRQLRVRKT